MSEIAFSELETKVETLPYYQIVLLRSKLDKIIEKRQERMSDEEARKLFDDFSGSVDREINEKEERGEWSGDVPPRSEWIKLSNISANLPSKIEFFVDKMEVGTYVFIVETSLRAGGKPLKKSVVFNSGIVKAVALGAGFGPAV